MRCLPPVVSTGVLQMFRSPDVDTSNTGVFRRGVSIRNPRLCMSAEDADELLSYAEAGSH